MKIRQMAERLNSVSIRKKAKQILAVTLAVLMVNPVTGYGVSAHAQETETITAFAGLSSEIVTQKLAVGAEKSAITLPDTLSVTISVYGADTAGNTVEESQPEEIPTEEVKPDESTPEKPAVDETPADDSTVSDNDAEEPQDDENGAEDNTATDSEATVVLDSGEVPLAASTTGSAISADLDDADTEQTESEETTSEERTLTGITWQLNAERSGSDTFNSESAGAVFFYEPVLPEGYVLADGISLPQIQVQIEDNSKWTFSQSQTIDGIEITVKAEKDVFPVGAVLHAEKVTSTEDKEKIQSAVSEEVQAIDTAKTVTKLVSFDITITDADGNELQPDTSKGEVKVSFAQLPMVTQEVAPTQELKVFHMDDTLSEAKGLDTTVDETVGTLEAPAEHFSLYTVALLTATAEDGEASVTDSEGVVTYYDTIEAAFAAAQGMSGCMVTLLQDVQTENAINISSGTFTFDLNGKAWTNTYSVGSGVLQLIGTSGNTVSLTVKDSIGGGSITTTASGVYSILGYTYYSLTLEGGFYTGIWADGKQIGNVLADGYAYKNNESGEWITDMSGYQISNVTVAQAPIEMISASVTEAGGAVHNYVTIEKAITAAQSMSGSTVTLLKDVATTSALTTINGNLIIDLNGKTWSAYQLNINTGSNVSIEDSAGGGTITATSFYVIRALGTLTLKGGTFTGGTNASIFTYEGTIADLLADGYAYQNSESGATITDMSDCEISNVTVRAIPVKIIAQPEDAIAAPGYTEAPAFTVTAETVPAGSGETISYQWYKDSTLIDSATSASYTAEAGLAEGNYVYYCAVTCDGYTVNTENATLFVTSATGNYTVTASNGITLSYPTLEAAITAAKSKPNSTVKLLADATTADMVEVSSGTFTIDLNGKTWTSTASDYAALKLTNGCHVTLMDSGTNGKFTTSTAQSAIFVDDANLTIESGIYENEKNNYMSQVLGAYSSGTITTEGGTFQTTQNIMYLAYFQSVDVVISGGTFSGGKTIFDNCDSVALSGGEYRYISTNNKTIVANLLTSGYGFKNVSGDTWVNQISGAGEYTNDLAHYFLQHSVTVQPVPVEITAQPQNAVNATYGYTSAPSMSVTAEKTAAAPTGSEISYQWYRVKSGSETSDKALGTTATQTIPTGLDAGTHSFYCVVSCDGYIVNSQSAEFTVDRKDVSTGTLALDIPAEGYTYDGTDKTPAVTLTLDGHALVLSADYILDYMDNTNAGTASVFITGVGNYTGTKGETFNIKKATPNITFEVKGTGVNDEIVYGGAVTYTVRVTGVDGEALTDASIVGVNCINGGNPVGYVMEYNTEKGAYFISQTDFRTEKPGTYPFYAVAVFAEESDTRKNYLLNENGGIESERILKTVQKADTSIAVNSSYVENYYYTGNPISNPVEADLSIMGASYSDVVFTWYDSNSNQLDTPPTTPGSYILAVSIPENDYFKSSSNTKSVTISSYDGTVAPAYNGNTTKADWYSADVAITADGYTVSDSMDGTYAESYLLSGEGAVNKTLYFKQNGTGYITDGKSVSVNIDKTAPAFSSATDGITISDNKWKQFLNNITFGKFFTDTKDVSISATDSGSGVAKYYYYIDTTGSTTVKTADELNTLSFTEGASFSITDENKYVIYAYVVDLAGNKSAYICTDGIVIDKTAPTVTLTAPAGSDLGDVSGAAKVQMNETGIITYVVKTTEQSGITAQDIFDSTEKNTVSVTDGKADTNIDVALSGLTANTTYYMYAVGTDSAENNGSVVSTSFTTTTTQPVFSENPTITGTYGQQVKDMTVSQPASTNGVAGSWSVSSTDQPSVGTSATYDVVFTPDDAVHYATVTISVTPTITRKSLTAAGVTIGEVTGIYTYDGTVKEPTVTVTDSAATITSSDYEYSYSNNTGAGTATVTVTAKGNYTGTVNRTFTIAKAPAPSITYPDASGITYGEKLSASVLTGGSTEYGSFAWTNGNTVPTVTNSDYEVTFTPNANTTANYEAITNTTKMVVITVSKVTPAVTVNAVVSDDAGSRKATLTATVTGAGNGETPTGTVKFVNSTSGSEEDIAGATTVTITGGKATYAWTGLAKQIYKVKAVYTGSGNYNTATSTELSFDTNKQNQVAFNIGSIGTKTYGDGTFTLSATGGSGGGAVTFESSDPTIVSIAGTTATIHKAGTVTITATKAADSTYNEATASVSLTVGKKTLIVKANDQLNIIKGAAIPELAYTVTGLVDSDTFTSPTISTTAADTNTVGEYDITISGGILANADSYAVTYANGKLTVVNATYTVTVTNGTGGGSYSEGQTVTITADSRGGYTFTGWSSSDGVTFASSTASTTTFTMPGKVVTVTANYSKNSSGDNGNTNRGSTSNNNNDTTNQNTTNNGSTTDNTSTTGTGTNQTVKETTQGGKVQQTDNLGRTEENQPYLSGDNGKSGWDAIITEVDESIDEEATEPVPLTVEMNGATIIPANVISQLRGKNVKLILNMGNGITWTINGMDVEDTELSDIDLGVTRNTSVIPENVVNGIRGENSSIQIELAHNGAFDFTATLSISFDGADAGKYANLFYYNEETGKLEYMESAQVSEDGTATLTFVHASAYSIVLSSAKMDESSITASESKGNNQANDNSKTVTTEVQATDETSKSMMVIWILLGVIVVVVIAGTTIYMKKKKDDKEENEA